MAERLNVANLKAAHKNPKYKKDYGTPMDGNAIFLPSISSLYTKHVSKDDSSVRNGDIPAGMTSIKDLNFLNPDEGIYWYPWELYSAGHAQLDIEKSKVQESIIQSRDPNSTFILADSGGFQLSTGVLS